MNSARPATQTISSVIANDPSRRRSARQAVARARTAGRAGAARSAARLASAISPAISAAPIAIAHSRQSASPIVAVGAGSCTRPPACRRATIVSSAAPAPIAPPSSPSRNARSAKGQAMSLVDRRRAGETARSPIAGRSARCAPRKPRQAATSATAAAISTARTPGSGAPRHAARRARHGGHRSALPARPRPAGAASRQVDGRVRVEAQIDQPRHRQFVERQRRARAKVRAAGRFRPGSSGSADATPGFAAAAPARSGAAHSRSRPEPARSRARRATARRARSTSPTIASPMPPRLAR